MKRYLKWIIILVVLALIIVVPILSGKNSIFKEINYVDFKEKLKSTEFTFIYIGSPTCSYCTKMRPYLAKLYDEYKIKIYYLNYARLTSLEITELKESDVRLNSMGTPTFIFVKNGQISGVKIGATSTYEEFKNIFDRYYYEVES
jgi:predicted bacteriocin transport accessory protein